MIYHGRVILCSDQSWLPFFDTISYRNSPYHNNFIIYDYFNARSIVKKLYDLQALQFT